MTWHSTTWNGRRETTVRILSVVLPSWRKVTGIAAASVVTAGVVLLGSPAAQAWDATVWDKVAACESSNRWDINTGNGYYGGLQFSPTTWKEFGGTAYASRADQATKAEQIAIARRVLAVQGPGAWPVCSKVAGLTKKNGGADTRATAGGGSSSANKGTPARKPATGSGKVITVQAGDTLSGLAMRHRVSGGWPALAKANNLDNPNFLYVGQRLVLPR